MHLYLCCRHLPWLLPCASFSSSCLSCPPFPCPSWAHQQLKHRHRHPPLCPLCPHLCWPLPHCPPGCRRLPAAPFWGWLLRSIPTMFSGRLRCRCQCCVRQWRNTMRCTQTRVTRACVFHVRHRTWWVAGHVCGLCGMGSEADAAGQTRAQTCSRAARSCDTAAAGQRRGRVHLFLAKLMNFFSLRGMLE